MSANQKKLKLFSFGIMGFALLHFIGGIFLLVAEGESVVGKTLQIGNTNSRYRFSIGARAFMDAWSKAGPAHHCAIGIGHVADKIEKLGFILGLPVVKVC